MAFQSRVAPGKAGRSAALDDIDRAIVDALRKDGRLSMRSLATQLHISRANVYSRVERLEHDGVITGYAAHIDPHKYGHRVSAYVFLHIRQQAWKSIREKVLKIREIDHVALVTGAHDIVVLARTTDVLALRELVLNKLQVLDGVESTQTELIFDELEPASTGAIYATR
jgi:DNA-binding Lrp family transcriptional regulator